MKPGNVMRYVPGVALLVSALLTSCGGDTGSVSGERGPDGDGVLRFRKLEVHDPAAGVNAFSYFCFPDHYTGYGMLRELGLANINSIRVLDAATGRWSLASVKDGGIIGSDFEVSRIAVILMDMKTPVAGWKPGE